MKSVIDDNAKQITYLKKEVDKLQKFYSDSLTDSERATEMLEDIEYKVTL